MKFQNIALLSTLIFLNLSKFGHASELSNNASTLPRIKNCQAHLNDHISASRERIAARLGVSENLLIEFYSKMSSSKSNAVDNSWQPHSCIKEFSRETLLKCLSQLGRAALNKNLFDYLFNLKHRFVKEIDFSQEAQKNIALLALLEDLTRENLDINGYETTWYLADTIGNPTRSFVAGKLPSDFAFQEGDIVIELGNSSVSSLITQATAPQRRYSHALMMKKTLQGTQTMEALLEKGVVSQDMKHFGSSTLNTLVVYRWADENKRIELAQKAAQCAWEHVEKNTPYDFPMDLGSDERIFCSELVAACYAKAAGITVKQLLPNISKVRDPKVADYLKKIGIQNNEIPSPGDLSSSPYLVPVAEYRRVYDSKSKKRSLHRMWEMILMGDVFIERLELGYKIKPTLFTKLIGLPALNMGDFGLDFLLGTIGVDWSLIPKGLKAQSLGVLFAQEKMIFAPAYKKASEELQKDGFDPSSLLDTPPLGA